MITGLVIEGHNLTNVYDIYRWDHNYLIGETAFSDHLKASNLFNNTAHKVAPIFAYHEFAKSLIKPPPLVPKALIR